jgi:hypothetical protein
MHVEVFCRTVYNSYSSFTTQNYCLECDFDLGGITLSPRRESVMQWKAEGWQASKLPMMSWDPGM